MDVLAPRRRYEGHWTGDFLGGPGGWNVIDAIDEVGHRRPDWTAGATVALADGSAWFLPRLDLPLLATRPGLVGDLRDLLALERNLARLEPGSAAQDRHASARFEAYRTLARRLLGLNYELAPDEWREVFPDDRGPWFLDLVCHLGDALILALLGDWRGVATSYLGAEKDAVLSN